VSAAAVRAFLERHGLLARRDLGQNFLFDDSLAARLVSLACVEPDDTVIEIGTGLGTLTRALASRAARVVTIEVDAGLVRGLRAESLLPGGVELVHADALELDLESLVSGAGARVRVVGNLPYSISAPVLRRLLDLRESLVGWSVMLQREVAERLVARPGTRDYGSLAVLHALAVEMEKTMQLAPRCFYPVPGVASTFVTITPRLDSPLASGELAAVESVVRAAFAHRRKTLVNALRGAGFGRESGAAVAWLEEQGLDPRARAESLSPDQLLALARALGPGSPGKAEEG
jgi:16S rRNA (adenine1518-N6/adenine1519-N6)-dimethyltransferase